MKKLIVIMLVLLTSVSAKFPSKIKLTYAPQQGSTSTYELKVKSVLVLKNINLKLLNLHTPNYTNYLNFVFTNVVDAVNKNGSITETVTYNDFTLEQELMGIRTPIDMDLELKGKSFTTTVSKDGTVIDTKGLDILAPTLRNLKLDNLFLQTRPVFPEKKIKVGDSWDNEIISKLPIKNSIVKTSMKMKYSLDGFERIDKCNCAVVGMKFETQTETIPVRKEKEDFVIEVNLTGSGSGKIYYDYAKSRVTLSIITMDLSSKINTTAQTGTSSLDTDQKVEMELKLLKKN